MTSMLSQIKKSYHILPSQNESVKGWKEKGKPVFGYVCINVPEEIMYAAGILPIRLLGTADDLIFAHNYCAGFLCHRMKSILELGLKGGLSLLDGIVMGYACEGGLTTMQPLVENVSFPYCEYLLLPDSRRPNAYVYFHKELARFKKTVEDFAGKEITDMDLSEAIRVYNENRALLTRAYDLRGGDKEPQLSGVEILEKHTGQKFAEEGLKGAMKLSQRTTELAQEITDLMGKTIPCAAGAGGSDAGRLYGSRGNKETGKADLRSDLPWGETTCYGKKQRSKIGLSYL